jgi:putative aminopeptidase FrvX
MSETEKDFLSLLTELLAAPSPSGREEKAAAVVRSHLDRIGYAPETDGAGNVIVRLAGRNPSAPSCILAAHLDEIGIVVTGVEDDGTLCVDRSGKLSPHKIGERPVEILGDTGSVTGILSFGSGHVAPGEKELSWSQARVITGLDRAELAKAGIRPGSTGVPVTEGRGPLLLGSGGNRLVAAWTLDVRAGVVVLLQLLRQLTERSIEPPIPTIIAFTIHEDVGCHGAKVLAQRERPEIFIAVDGCPWTRGTAVEVNDQPAAFSKDLLAHYDQRLIHTFAQAAKNAGTELQTALLSNAFSDASAVYNSGGAQRVGILGHVRYNSHGFEVAKLGVFPKLLNTLLQLPKF